MNEGCHRQPLFIAGNIIKEPSFRTALINSNLIRRLLFSRSFLGSLLCSINYCLSRLGICYRIEIIFSRIDGLNFLDADRDLSVRRLNACNLSCYFLTDCKNISRALKSYVRDLRYVAESIEIGLKLYECTEVSESYNCTLNDSSNGDSLLDVVERIILFLLESEGDLLCLLIKALNVNVNFLSDRKNIGRLGNSLP